MANQSVFNFTQTEEIKAASQALNQPISSLIGEKGEKISEISNLTIPLCPGFIISTTATQEIIKNETPQISESIWNQILDQVQKLEETSSSQLGNAEHPLFLMLKPSPAYGQSDLVNIPNIGINDQIIDAILPSVVESNPNQPQNEEQSQEQEENQSEDNPSQETEQQPPEAEPENKETPAINSPLNIQILLESYKQLIQIYGTLISKIPDSKFDSISQNYLKEHNIESTSALEPVQLRELTNQYKDLIQSETSSPFPQDPKEQLHSFITAIFTSSPKSVEVQQPIVPESEPSEKQESSNVEKPESSTEAQSTDKESEITSETTNTEEEASSETENMPTESEKPAEEAGEVVPAAEPPSEQVPEKQIYTPISETAIIVTKMVFTMYDNGISGKISTRNDKTGEQGLVGEFTTNNSKEPETIASLENANPSAYKELISVANLLETHFKCICQISFAIDFTGFYILSAKHEKSVLDDLHIVGNENFHIIIEMANSKVLTHEEIIASIDPMEIENMAKAKLSEEAKTAKVLCHGTVAAPGFSSGVALCASSAQKAREAIENAETEEKSSYILFIPSNQEWSYEDISLGSGIVLYKQLPNPMPPESSHEEEEEEEKPKKKHVVKKKKVVPPPEPIDETAIAKWTSAASIANDTPCITDCELMFDEENSLLIAGEAQIHDGDPITINGDNGDILIGSFISPGQKIEENQDISLILQWADEIRHKLNAMQVWIAADNPDDVSHGKALSADGIFAQIDNLLVDDRISPLNRYLTIEGTQAIKKLAKEKKAALAAQSKKKKKANTEEEEQEDDTSEEDKKAALDEMEEALAADLTALMDTSLPLVVRGISKPIMEFAGNIEELRKDLISAKFRKKWGGEIEEEEINEKEIAYDSVSRFLDFNPALGLKGVRALIEEPWLLTFQSRAISDAAAQAYDRASEENQDDEGEQIHIPNIDVSLSIPFVMSEKEISEIKNKFEENVAATIKEKSSIGSKCQQKVKLDASIEIPRAAVAAERIGALISQINEQAGVEIGVDSLIELGNGYQKMNEGAWMARYIEKGVIEQKPKDIDEGTRRLIALATERAAKGGNKRIGVFGKRLGTVKTLQLCSRIGINWIALPSEQIPLARLVAAQSVLN